MATCSTVTRRFRSGTRTRPPSPSRRTRDGSCTLRAGRHDRQPSVHPLFVTEPIGSSASSTRPWSCTQNRCHEASYQAPIRRPITLRRDISPSVSDLRRRVADLQERLLDARHPDQIPAPVGLRTDMAYLQQTGRLLGRSLRLASARGPSFVRINSPRRSTARTCISSTGGRPSPTRCH